MVELKGLFKLAPAAAIKYFQKKRKRYHLGLVRPMGRCS